MEHITCTACLADPRAHYMHPVGFDRLGRPVLYSCLQLAANRSVEDNRRHMIATFEQVGRACHTPASLPSDVGLGHAWLRYKWHLGLLHTCLPGTSDMQGMSQFYLLHRLSG